MHGAYENMRVGKEEVQEIYFLNKNGQQRFISKKIKRGKMKGL